MTDRVVPHPYNHDERLSASGPERAPGVRTFSLNDPEAYEALAAPRERPWIPNGALPREPRLWERSAERSEQAGSATRAARRDAKPVRPTTAAGVSIDVTNLVRDGPTVVARRGGAAVPALS